MTIMETNPTPARRKRETVGEKKRGGKEEGKEERESEREREREKETETKREDFSLW